MVLSIKRNRSNKGSTLGCIFHKFINPFKKSKQENQFTNDVLFEHNRYKQQKQNSQHGILLNKPSRHARHGSTQSAIVFGTQPKKPSKHIRNYSHVSCISASNITVNSEDLTAKEFAEIAGIQILSDDEEEEQEKKCAFCCSDMSSSLIVTNQCTVSSTLSSTRCSEDGNMPHNIWDLEFWKHPSQPVIPILDQLKQDTLIKKGRFEITIGIDHHHHSLSVPNISSKPVIEWKRKHTLK
ncbi:unnamed protein product [Rhizopus stolonifer]